MWYFLCNFLCLREKTGICICILLPPRQTKKENNQDQQILVIFIEFHKSKNYIYQAVNFNWQWFQILLYFLFPYLGICIRTWCSLKRFPYRKFIKAHISCLKVIFPGPLCSACFKQSCLKQIYLLYKEALKQSNYKDWKSELPVSFSFILKGNIIR